jgi:hypothetical protein
MSDLSIERQLADLNRSIAGIYENFVEVKVRHRWTAQLLRKSTRTNRILEIIIAVGASGSGVAGFALWKSEIGQYIWGSISGASILFSVVKPILNPASTIEKYSKLSSDYASLSARCDNLLQNIKESISQITFSASLPDGLKEELVQIRSKIVELASQVEQTDTQRFASLRAQVNVDTPRWSPFSEETTPAQASSSQIGAPSE